MILVLGSINMDLFFTVQALPKAGETVLCAGAEMRPGGKGANQAYAAARAGAETAFFGCIGDDAFGPIVRAALDDAGCETSHLTIVDAPTGTAAVMVEASGENQIVVASGANLSVRANMIPDAALGPTATLLCQMEIPVAETEAALIRAKAAGARTILNLAPASPLSDAALAAVDALVVNEVEARMLAPNGGSIREIAETLARDQGLTCVVTLGAAGAFYTASDGQTERYPAREVEAVDTVGAGDAFVGALAAALDSGALMAVAMQRALVAGAITCTRHGAMTAPTAEEIDGGLARSGPLLRD
jgi:ribokinase